MSEIRHTGRVGLFVIAGLVLIGALMLSFTRGTGLFKPTYELTMQTRSAGGLKVRSAVLMSGVQIGSVKSIDLDSKTRNVIIRLRILQSFPIHSNARFSIEQFGMLGDQFVTVDPGTVEAPALKDGDTVAGVEPFNLQEVARSASDLLKRFDQLSATIGGAIERVNAQVLDTNTLGSLARTIGKFERVSEQTLTVVETVGVVVTNNAPTLMQSLSNLFVFTERMQKLAGELDETVAANRNGLAASLKNVEDASGSLKKLAADAEAGHGVIGGLFRDEQMRNQLSQTVSNASILASNLARYGILYKPKLAKDLNTNAPIYTGKSAFK
jgi:phospholipid/cholesterol/gamma-HCH transport system substrate-binding protein